MKFHNKKSKFETTVGDDFSAKLAFVLVYMLYRYDETQNI
jgi:hypothetical protein